MRSLQILRVGFFALMLVLTGTTIYTAVNDGTNAAIETACSTAFIGLFGCVSRSTAEKALNVKTRKQTRINAVAAVNNSQVVILPRGGMQTRGVGEQDLMGRNPEFAGQRSGSAQTLQSGMNTPVNMVIPESTMAGILSFTMTADGAHVKTNKVPFLPTTPTDALPAGVTFTGSNFTDFDSFRDFYIDTPVILGQILISTDVQANFTNPITVTTLSPNGSPTTTNLSWNSISKNPSNNDQTCRIINYSGWMIGVKKVRYELTLNVSSSMTFDCSIAQVGDAKAFRPYNG